MKPRDFILLNSVLFLTFNAFANSGSDFSGGGFYGGQNLLTYSEMSEHEKYSYLSSKENQESVAQEISRSIMESKAQAKLIDSDFGGVGSVGAFNDLVNKYNLNHANYRDIRDSVLEQVALKIATPIFEYEEVEETEDLSISLNPKIKNTLKSDKLEVFEQYLKEIGLPAPTGLDKAKKLSDIYLETKGSEEDFFKRIKAELPEKYLHAAIKGGASSFYDSKTFIKSSIRVMIDAESVDEDYLYDLLLGQLNANSMHRNWKVDGLLDLILEHIDIDHKPSSGSYSDSVLCSTVENLSFYRRIHLKNQASDNTDSNEWTKTNKQQNAYMESSKIGLVSQIDHLLKLGANFGQDCQNGTSPRESLGEMALDNFINISGTLIEHDLFGEQEINCIKSSGLIDLAQLCINLNVLNSFEKAEKRNKESIKNYQNKEVEFVNSYGASNGCNIVFFDKMMSRSGKGMTSLIEVRISNPSYKEDYTLSTKSKAEFMKQLQKLLKE